MLELLSQASRHIVLAFNSNRSSQAILLPVKVRPTPPPMFVLAVLISVGVLVSAQAQKPNASLKSANKVNKKSGQSSVKATTDLTATQAANSETVPSQSSPSFSGSAVLQKRNQDQQDSVHSVVKQLLGHLTGPVGKKRDWEAVRKLFLPEANMVVNGAKGVKVLPASTLWLNGDSLYGKVAFQEAESSFACQISGTIATVQQGYFCAVNNKPSHYGTNVYTLIKRPEGNWQINHLAWYQLPIK